MATNIELASFQEIIEELGSRFENIAVIVSRPCTGHEETLQRSGYKGDHDILLGLITTLQYEILKDKEEGTSLTDDI